MRSGWRVIDHDAGCTAAASAIFAIASMIAVRLATSGTSSASTRSACSRLVRSIVGRAIAVYGMARCWSVLALAGRREAVEDALELGVVGDHLQGGGADLAGLVEQVGVAHARGEGDDGLDVAGVDGDDGAQVLDGLARAAELAQIGRAHV